MHVILRLKSTDFWLKWAVFNFSIVAALGALMRYNILYSLPIFQHKFMQQSHSHFAFYGWVSACIYALVYYFFKEQNLTIRFGKYRMMMLINQIGAFGMLFSFLYGGYYWLSIAFSSLSFMAGIAYFIFIIRDTKGLTSAPYIWLKCGGFFAVLSVIGIFGLAYFTSRKEIFDVWYRASTYFYLHYQYNGFFLFSCIGLFLFYLQKLNIYIPLKQNKRILLFLFFGAFFGYGLSTLWIETSRLYTSFWILVALVQLYGAYLLIGFALRYSAQLKKQTVLQRILYAVFGFVFWLKFILPFLSTIPVFTQTVFFNMNIVMAYLHLILLVGISLFLIWLVLDVYKARPTFIYNFSVCLLFFGILLNEVLLAALGLTAFVDFTFVHAQYWLFVSALIILVAISMLFIALRKEV